MLFEGSPGEADAVVRAMKGAATARGARPLHDADRVALTAAHTIVFRGAGELDVDALTDISPVELAERVTEHDHRSRAAALIAVMTTVDEEIDAQRIGAAADYADGLGLDEPYIRDLVALGQHRLAQVRADITRRNERSFTGRDLHEGIDEWINVYRDHPDPELHTRYAALASCPAGSLGCAFADFYTQNQFEYAGDPSSPNDEFTTPHDCVHILSGYDTSLQGELLVSTFTAGMHPRDAISAHLIPVLMSWQLGVGISEFSGAATGKLDPPKFWTAWTRGDQTTGDVLAPEWDFWSQVERPLADVRAELGVPPLDPADAADGDYPAWYRPGA